MMKELGMNGEPLFIRTVKGEKSAIPPIWFMRQAGRYLPEYRELRAKAGSFLDLCFNPTLASEVTLQPIRRFDLDAAILFADILLIPHALGQGLRFAEGEGPILEPVITHKALDLFRKRDVCGPLEPVFETVRRTREALAPDKALIGFAGAPWTVATYMLAGGSVKDPAALRAIYYENPAFITDLIDLLIDKTVDYLIAQIDAGADAIQLFDTWASGLPPAVLDVFSVIPMQSITRRVKAKRPGTPVILFPKGVGEKIFEYALIKEADAIGIDYAIDPAFVREKVAPLKTVQGGLDPLLVVSGGERMERSARDYLNMFHDTPYVFNLGHGFTPQTPPENVARLIELVRDQ